MDAPLLQTRGLTKRYGDVTVLDDVSMEVRGGEIHALLGANGAGKSTLCKIISGLTPASDGSMQLGGVDFNPQAKQQAEAAGVEIVQQELNLIGTLSVAENIFLTRLPSLRGVLRQRQLHQQTRAQLDRFGLTDVPTHAAVETLGVGRQQMVEITTALARQCRLLILDEPTAALSGSESEQLFAHLRSLRDQGVGILYISHRLDEVAQLTDRITILRDGKFVATRNTSSASTDEMVDLMSGQNLANKRSAHTCHRRDEIAMRVRSLSNAVVRDVSFEVRRGERLGITGLVGSGRTELLRAIFGADVATTGSVFLQGDSQGRRFQSPSQAVQAGLAMVTEDRKQNGLLLSQSISTNTSLSSLQARFSRMGLIKGREERRAAQRWVDELETRCQDIDQPAGTLSGGNQQKVVVSKWLVRDAEVFLFDEPTRGIDVAARRRIYRLLESLAAEGKASVIVSSDLEELFEICDAIAVMCEGRLVDVFQRDQWSHEKIMQASFSGYVK
ncbi:sugar ABC transporter ATP-binding protein [Roseimaritima ulvae]|uniref:Galactose/methyl galactoside import ATP-binding protein MglA n=1 Tax=Roseimaritima ulvae TaxID=980254 RepID=A0A5B9QYR6_9BACT|nr:sugar ABC transporter ATP-binding protein [Roseimaritima ulvae]QEG39093.1 Galactose/methyl galactoside import ATP-binding protein MglA [Roseimaritima ulvae]